MSDNLSDSHFGDVGKPLPDWRKIEDDTPDDDEPLAETPPDVTDMLGFDPLEEDDAEPAQDAAAWNEEDHPRDEGGRFGSGGGGSLPSPASVSIGNGSQEAVEQIPPPNKVTPTRTKMQAVAKTALSMGRDPEKAAADLKKLAAGTKNPGAAKYANQLLAHIEQAHWLAPGTLGKAQPKGAAPPPDIGPGAAKERYQAIKDLAARVRKGTENKLPKALEHIPMKDLQSALNDLWDTRMDESGALKSPRDIEINDTLRGEIQRRITQDHEDRQKRADSYAYMDDAEIKQATGMEFSGDSHMKPGMKRQLALLPPSHLRRLAASGMTVQAVKELAPMSADHPYAPGMQPAGLFEPGRGRMSVADEITLPDGSKRLLSQRAAVLRHEVGHAIDDVTGLSHNADFIAAMNQGIERMTPEERQAARYWLGEGASNEFSKLSARRSETFAEMYAYAFDEGADAYSSFGGLTSERRFTLFAPARKVMREIISESLGDRVMI